MEYPKCYECKWFIRGSWGHGVQPDEQPECGHSVAWASSTLPNFPFNNGCKHFEEKVSGPVKRIGEEG